MAKRRTVGLFGMLAALAGAVGKGMDFADDFERGRKLVRDPKHAVPEIAVHAALRSRHGRPAGRTRARGRGSW